MIQAGDIIGGKYTIVRKIASGGQSHVFLAQTENGVPWTVKAVRTDDHVSGIVSRRNLETEINVLKRLEHPGLVRIADVVLADGYLCMVSEYIRGMTLAESVKKNGPMPEEAVTDIGMQICDVLGYLHSRKRAIIYRDCKPSNLIMRPDGRIALIDFGTAHVNGPAQGKNGDLPLGTHGYAAPEQYEGSDGLSDATDVYALGKTMVALLSGGRPGVRIRRLKGVSKHLRDILRRCTSENPRRRYASVAEVYQALRHPAEYHLKARIVAFLRIALFLAVTAGAVWCFVLWWQDQRQTLIHGAVLAAVTMVLWSLLDVSGALPDLFGLSEKLAVARTKESARVNGVFRIGHHMPTKRAISWQDIEIPLDDAMTDVRLEADGDGVNFAAMKGFRIERDVMVTLRENYSVVK